MIRGFSDVDSGLDTVSRAALEPCRHVHQQLLLWENRHSVKNVLLQILQETSLQLIQLFSKSLQHVWRRLRFASRSHGLRNQTSAGLIGLMKNAGRTDLTVCLLLLRLVLDGPQWVLQRRRQQVHQLLQVCDAVSAVQRQALLLPAVSAGVWRLHSLTDVEQHFIRNALRSLLVPLETHMQRTAQEHLTETHTVLSGQLVDLVSHALVVEVVVQQQDERLRVCVCVRDALLLQHLLEAPPDVIITVRECVSLIRECVSLIRECASLIRECASLIRECVSLIRECASLIRECVSLTQESLQTHQNRLPVLLPFSLSISSEERPSTTERETEPRRTGSVLVSGDPDANTDTRKITHFFTKTPVRVACRRAAAVADGKALSSDVTGLGVPVADLRRAPVCSGPLPALRPTDGHAVMIRTDLLDPGKVPVPYPSPERRSDCWDNWHVKMPCSEQNLFPADRTTLQSRWDLIHQALSVPLRSSHDVKDAILKYNAGQAKAWNFSALHSYCKGLQESEAEQMFGELLPAMAQLALRAPSLFTQPIPLLRTQCCRSITLSQEQVSSLLANAFFCTFPRRSSRRTDSSNYPDINFNRLFEGPSPKKLEKLKTLLCYFERITRRRPTGLITYTRQCLQRLPSWASSEKQFSKLHISCDGTIEEQGYGMLQVDFANRFVGGGVTGSGLVQEEIRFLINPELIAARLFTEALEDNECLIITGTEQFSRYSGYSDTYRWDGNHDDQTPRDEWQRRVTEIVAIDALHYRNFLQQFHPENMTRELNKAYCGFTRPGVQTENLSSVATGNWGCGAFGGDTRLKAVLQMMAAAEAERDLMYFTFGDAELVTDVHRIHTLITRNHASVGSVFNMLLQYYERVIKETSRAKPQKTLYSFLSEHL